MGVAAAQNLLPFSLSLLTVDSPALRGKPGSFATWLPFWVFSVYSCASVIAVAHW